MRNLYLEGQEFLFDGDPALELQKKKRNPRDTEPIPRPIMVVDMRNGGRGLIGPCWERDPQWLIDQTGPLHASDCPIDVIPSSLAEILQDIIDAKYYLSKDACLGILRRAEKRSKGLPEELETALEIQSGIVPPCAQIDGMKAYHINQRDEGIDLDGISGALMATNNMQMQTFVVQSPSGEQNHTIAFAANQRDEVRDLQDVAGALSAQPGMKQQTFVASFSAGAGSTAGGIGYSESVAPTLKGTPSGNCMPSVLCLNDQGGRVMDCSEDLTGTLRAQEHGHQPLVLSSQPALFENHGIDSRYRGPLEVAPTLSARAGTGGNNLPLVSDTPCFCIMGNAIDRMPHNGGNGIGYQEDTAYTLTATDHHAVYSRQRVDIFLENDVASTESARQHKDATDLVFQPKSFTQPNHDGEDWEETCMSDAFCQHMLLIRRLTPMECERLQGYPDGWTALSGASDSSRYKALGNSVAIPCVEHLMGRIASVLFTDLQFFLW